MIDFLIFLLGGKWFVISQKGVSFSSLSMSFNTLKRDFSAWQWNKIHTPCLKKSYRNQLYEPNVLHLVPFKLNAALLKTGHLLSTYYENSIEKIWLQEENEK